MKRSVLLFPALVLVAGVAMAQKTAPSLGAVPEGTRIDLDSIKVTAQGQGPMASYVEVQGLSEATGVRLDRPMLSLVQGNIDRETVEFRNGEN